MKAFWLWLLRSKGWKTDLVFPFHHVKKYVLIVAPHTSNWDFIIGLAYRSILKMNDVKFLGKRELFSPPFGWIFRWLGGIPVDRTSHHNLVDQVAAMFKQTDIFRIALAPEGTRRKVEKLKSGFYFIAAKAQVPIIMVGFDYVQKTVLFSDPFVPSGDFETELRHIYAFYRGIHGRHPEQGLMDK